MPWFTGLDKKYIARMHFGVETDTLDPEGDVVAESTVPAEFEVREALSHFRGLIEQVPPAYSAIHTGGERAHRLVRAGKEVKLPSRQVEIYEIELQAFEPPEATIAVHCSKGTYIRSLVRDIGLQAGSRAYVRELRRTDIGPFSVRDARPPEEVELAHDSLLPGQAMMSLGKLARTYVEPAVARTMMNGGRIDSEVLGPNVEEGSDVLVLDSDNRMLAIVAREGEHYLYRLVVPRQVMS